MPGMKQGIGSARGNHNDYEWCRVPDRYMVANINKNMQGTPYSNNTQATAAAVADAIPRQQAAAALGSSSGAAAQQHTSFIFATFNFRAHNSSCATAVLQARPVP